MFQNPSFASVWQHFFAFTNSRAAVDALWRRCARGPASVDVLWQNQQFCRTKFHVKEVHQLVETSTEMASEDLPLSPGIFGQMGNDLMPRIMEELLPDQGDVGAVEAWLAVGLLWHQEQAQNSVSDLSWTIFEHLRCCLYSTYVQPIYIVEVDPKKYAGYLDFVPVHGVEMRMTWSPELTMGPHLIALDLDISFCISWIRSNQNILKHLFFRYESLRNLLNSQSCLFQLHRFCWPPTGTKHTSN